MWQRRRSRARLARAASRASRRGGRKNPFLSALGLAFGLAGGSYLIWLLALPNQAGEVGRWAHRLLVGSLGGAAFALPLFLAAALWGFLKSRAGRPSGWITTAAACAVGVTASASLLAAAGSGGALGAAVRAQLVDPFGSFGAFALSLAALLFSLQVAFALRWTAWATRAFSLVVEDYRQWRRSRQELAAQWAKAKEAPAKPPSTQAGSRAEEPRIEAPRPAPKPIETNGHAKKPAPVESDAAPKAPPPSDSPYKNYVLPPIDLLQAPQPAADRGKPRESEIQAAIADLERTLKSFGVEAAVTGYAPGPVITRYELAPAPGVKVSSIVALENDLALALKAKGIRIIAPIPGKAAVGIEIPNIRPALVVLREILESPALPPQAPLLSFGLGLASDGEPKAADLQKMPHLLVAGATNSGKSVAIHAMILSILFRARPDEVKFLLIDPKRLELTFYDGIPHLFDPTQSPEKASVVTSPKDAAKSLAALVKLMERRYEKFQLFGVRNIDSYNREADKRGTPREYFIVVVIDELADLMLVAQDSVEDSIQRLTQMARAVGIHLVLATQRPSVDVITGVIKANLPCRIALQVISRVDSKVILDCQGAESLQGKGDLLYLAAGAQKPERCQGAFVGEEEISRVAQYLKAQGKPHYPVLETMTKNVEADLSNFGVEPLEFSQALKLVLERRRVSQDLLKSQFGSSARATNLLSLLEVKEMIHKPEGSNRWDIHFDAIEDYLRQHFPQVPIDDKSSA